MMSWLPAALAAHLWQSTWFVGAIWLATLALRRHDARLRYWLWMAGSIKFLVPFSWLISIGAQFEWRTAPVIARPAAVFVMNEVFAPSVLVAAPAKLTQQATVLPWLLVAVWLAGAAAVFFWWWRQWLPLGAALREATPVTLSGDHVTEGLAVMTSPSMFEPGVIGIRRPVLLVPDGLVERLTRAQLNALLAHERCHVRCHDNLVAAIHMAVEAIFWFHPLVWWIAARQVDERERACDEAVLRAGSEPSDYAEGILTVCRWSLASPLMCVSGISGSDLRARIESIMTSRIGRRLTARGRVLVALGAATVLAGPIVLGLSAQSSNAPLGQSQTAQNELAFEVASIKPNTSDAVGVGGLGWGPDSIRGRNQSPASLLRIAFGVQADQIINMPAWASSERFNINAKVAPGTVFIAMTMLQPMLRKLLEDRFQLKIHHETRELNVYHLLRVRADRLGPKLVAAPANACSPPDKKDAASLIAAGRGCSAGPVPGGISVQGMPLATLTGLIAPSLERVVVDETGLTGNWDLGLSFVNQVQDANGDGPSLFTALQEQLGLKLEAGRAPVDVIVIDGLERPTPD